MIRVAQARNHVADVAFDDKPMVIDVWGQDPSGRLGRGRGQPPDLEDTGSGI